MDTLISVPRGPVFDSFFNDANIKLAMAAGNVIWNTGSRNFTGKEAAERIGNSDCYVTLWGSPRLDGEILKNAPRLRLLTHLGGTVVPFVSEEMWRRGIRVISANDYFAESVAEGTLAYILSALRDIPRYSELLKNKKQWKSADSYTAGLMGRTVGLVSYGAVARHLVRILSQFKIRLMVYDIRPIPEEDVKKYGIIQSSLTEIFSTCDIISLHTPLLDATRHMINGELLGMIKDGALFVNTSRGAVVDQDALIKELAKGRFRAVLDVYEKEPPQSDCALFDLPGVIMMPHMAGPTTDMRSYFTRELLCESIDYIDSGKPLKHEITYEVAKTMSLK